MSCCGVQAAEGAWFRCERSWHSGARHRMGVALRCASLCPLLWALLCGCFSTAGCAADELPAHHQPQDAGSDIAPETGDIEDPDMSNDVGGDSGEDIPPAPPDCPAGEAYAPNDEGEGLVSRPAEDSRYAMEPVCAPCAGGYYCAGGDTLPLRCVYGDRDGNPATPCVFSEEVTAGGSHTCERDSLGRVTCWGYAGQGLDQIPDGLEAAALTAGSRHTCALTFDSRVVCWGSDSHGQSTPPEGLEDLVALSAGTHHTCALQESGEVTCWGRDDYGQSTPPEDLAPAQTISTGGFHTCALHTSGEVTCWGRNSNGQSTPPADLDAVALSAGSVHTCALLRDASLVCWGSNGAGRSRVPTEIEPLTAASAGGLHTCALTALGEPICWGDDLFGQATPPSDLSLYQLSAGGEHTCALDEQRRIHCWGHNNYGQSDTPFVELVDLSAD